jgi:NTE family protein
MSDEALHPSRAVQPVEDAGRPGEPAAGTALCLSGGGYRAMLFHVGAIIRLNEVALLQKLDRVSSVSGGSITAATLALAWTRLEFGTGGVATNLDPLVVDPLRSVARRTVDVPAVLTGPLLPWRTISQRVAEAYDDHLFHGATLAQLPADGQGPRFVINATNLQTGKLYRFSRPYEGDYTVGLWRDPTTRVADAVAASSAFPPVLSPARHTPTGTFDAATAGPLSSEDYRREVVLADGGVYDNLGLETAWKRYARILVSDGGGPFRPDPGPHGDWVRQAIRVGGVVDSQVRALRKRQLVESYRLKLRTGTYWGLRSDVPDYGLPDPFPIPPDEVARAREVPTRLAALDDATERALVNWGYVIADTALRTWVDRGLPAPTRLPIQ